MDGGENEVAAAETTVEPRPNGPLFVRGRLKIVDADGRLIREDTRLALCRCGASENKPFCDGSHRRVGFTTTPYAGHSRGRGAAGSACSEATTANTTAVTGTAR